LQLMDQTGHRYRGWELTLHLVEMVTWWPSLPAPIVYVTTAQSRRAVDRPKTCARRSDTPKLVTRAGVRLTAIGKGVRLTSFPR
jgi:hypothetical protein